MLLLGLVSAASALTVTSPDGIYALELSESWIASGAHRASPMRNAFDLELMEARPTDGLPLPTVSAMVVSEQQRTSTGTWSGEVSGREVACTDTAGAAGLKPDLRSFCVVELDDWRVAVIVMQTRQLFNARSYATIFRAALGDLRLLDAAPESISLLPEQGYACFSGRWNAGAPEDDLEIWWQPEQQKVVARFQTLDGPRPVSFLLTGTVEIGGEEGGEFFGYLDQFDGPTESRSGIHRLFGAMGVQGELSEGVPVRIRAAQDPEFTDLTACAAPGGRR